MVVQKTFNNLKEGPKEDKVAVASGIAVSVVVVLLAAWAIYFLHSIQRGSQQLNLTGAGSQFAPSSVTDAQRQLQQEFGSSTQEFQDIQNQSQNGNAQMQTQQMQVQGDDGTGQFGGQNYSQ